MTHPAAPASGGGSRHGVPPRDAAQLLVAAAVDGTATATATAIATATAAAAFATATSVHGPPRHGRHGVASLQSREGGTATWQLPAGRTRRPRTSLSLGQAAAVPRRERVARRPLRRGCRRHHAINSATMPPPSPAPTAAAATEPVGRPHAQR